MIAVFFFFFLLTLARQACDSCYNSSKFLAVVASHSTFSYCNSMVPLSDSKFALAVADNNMDPADISHSLVDSIFSVGSRSNISVE